MLSDPADTVIAEGSPESGGALGSSRTNRRYPSPSVAAAIDALVALSASVDEPLQVRQLARTLGVPHSTLHRILQTLEAKGLIVRGEGTGYVIGDGVLELGRPYRLRRLAQLAEPQLRALNQQTRETVNLALYQDDAMVILKTLESPEPLRTVSWEGRRDRLHSSALGKACLATLPLDTLEDVLARLPLTAETARSIVTLNSLRGDLAQARARGYAIDDEEAMDGVRCVAAAIQGPDSRVVGAVSVSAPSARFSVDTAQVVGLLVVRAAEALSTLVVNL